MQIKCEICNNIMSDQIKGPTQSQGFKSIFWALGIIIMFSSVYALLKLASILMLSPAKIKVLKAPSTAVGLG